MSDALARETTAPSWPTVSVVVPVRDDAAHLAALLPLLQAQSMTPAQILVVDNASRDRTPEVARAAGCEVVHEPVVGIPAATAAGYDAARGAVILRCDADSRPGPRWIERHLRALERGGERTVAVVGPARFDLPPVVAEAASLAYLGMYNLASFAALAHLPLYGTNMALRRSWWVQVRGCAARTPDVHDDMDLSFCLRPGERIGYVLTNPVGMAGRALRPGPAARMRLERGFATVRRAWDRQPPWERWRERIGAWQVPFRR